MAIGDKAEKKNKSITFVSNAKDGKGKVELDTDEDLSNTIVLLGNKFNRVLKILDKRGRSDVKNISYDISNSLDSQKRI